jgi:hypothetical protein
MISHLAEQMQVGTADRQYLLATLQVDTSGLVFVATQVADRTKVYYDRAVHLHELLLIELCEQILQWDTDQRLV